MLGPSNKQMKRCCQYSAYTHVALVFFCVSLTLASFAAPQKAAKLQSSLHFLGAKRQNTHIVFVDGKEKLQSFDAAKHFDTAPELVDRAFNRPRVGGPTWGAHNEESAG